MVRAFKAVSTPHIRTTVDPSLAWQRNYHDRISRSDLGLNRGRRYVANNPVAWETDDHNPAQMPPLR